MDSGGKGDDAGYAKEMDDWAKDLRQAREQVWFFRIIFIELSFNVCIFVSEYMCIYDNSIFRDSMYQAMIRGK